MRGLGERKRPHIHALGPLSRIIFFLTSLFEDRWWLNLVADITFLGSSLLFLLSWCLLMQVQSLYKVCLSFMLGISGTDFSLFLGVSALLTSDCPFPGRVSLGRFPWSYMHSSIRSPLCYLYALVSSHWRVFFWSSPSLVIIFPIQFSNVFSLPVPLHCS